MVISRPAGYADAVMRQRDDPGARPLPRIGLGAWVTWSGSLYASAASTHVGAAKRKGMMRYVDELDRLVSREAALAQHHNPGVCVPAGHLLCPPGRSETVIQVLVRFMSFPPFPALKVISEWKTNARSQSPVE